MWNQNHDTNEAICEAEADSQTQNTDMLPRRGGEGWIGGLGLAGVN